MSKIVVINNYVEIPEESKVCRHNNDNVILFLGKMDYEPNVTAVKYFAEDIFPQLKLAFPQIRFVIIGAKPADEVLSLAHMEGIKITGYVESTAPYFQDATIVVAPMLSGAGVQNKIIQAMSYGCCVATTDIGAEGLDVRRGDLAIFNGTKEWVDGLSKLLSNRGIRLKCGKLAREMVKNSLSKEIIFKQFCKMIDNLESL